MSPALGLGWRFSALGGFAAGLGVSPVAAAESPPWWIGLASMAVLAVARPRHERVGALAALWLVTIALAAALVGAAVGAARLAAIDGGALDLAAGERVRLDGVVIAVPRRTDGEVRVRVQTPDGRVLVVASEPVPDLPVGGGLRAAGAIRDPAEWERGYLRRLGVADVLVADSIVPTGARRGGAIGLLDGVRIRAEAALGRGTSAPAAALLRGFVLGQDDRIDPEIVDQFKRSGLAHLLAVSGQNVVLLAILAGVVLAALGVPIRARLAWILFAIAVYVPVAGGGASIQRAGIMGAAGVVAALGDRPRSRWYALLLAAATTLALNPRASGDVGWQLSFAAVVGILALAAPLARAFGGGRSGPRAALAEGAALTVAATLATAPLMAHHFGTAALLALPANLAALPAVAPVMWLGMLAAALGQVAWIPVEPVTWLAGLLAGVVAQAAAWFSAPSWALVEASLPGAGAVIAAYAALAAIAALGIRWSTRRRRLVLGRRRRMRRGRAVAIAALGVVAVVVPLSLWLPRAGPERSPRDGLTVRVLDVGQGEAILLQPGAGAPILIDAGPPDAGVAERLDELGVSNLAALIATHPSLDHLGGVGEVLERVATERFVCARIDRPTLALARAAGSDLIRVAAGDRLRAGSLRLQVLSPARADLGAARGTGAHAGDPNRLALVLLARWRGFEILLTADAEAELAPLDPGRIDVLKVAHHGSEDAGLSALLERAQPRLALISVGAGNDYGHPAAATLAGLAEAEVETLRTDVDGEITIDVGRSGWYLR